MSYERNRGSVFLEDARILAQRAGPGSSSCCASTRRARRARRRPARSRTSPAIPRCRCAGRCRSCVRSAAEGWLEFLYKPKGHGLEMLGLRQPGEVVERARADRSRLHRRSGAARLLALGGGVGIPPMIFLAEQVRADRQLRPLVLMGSEVPFPFELVESQLAVPGVAQGGNACRGAARAVGRALAAREQRRHRGRASRLHHGSRARRVAGDDRSRARAKPKCSRAARRRC